MNTLETKTPPAPAAGSEFRPPACDASSSWESSRTGVDLDTYICRTKDAEKKARLRLQWAGAVDGGVIVCCCGLTRHLTHAYRCLYCGEWYCVDCAGAHFGETIQEWVARKREEAYARRRSPNTELTDRSAGSVH